jgi:hypothetical protein
LWGDARAKTAFGLVNHRAHRVKLVAGVPIDRPSGRKFPRVVPF